MPIDIDVVVAANVRRLRIMRGLTQEQLAARAELSPQHVSRIECGVVSPTVRTLERISRSLNAPLWEFFTVTDMRARADRMPTRDDS